MVTIKSLGNIEVGKYKIPVEKLSKSGILSLERKLDRKEHNIGAFLSLKIPMQKREILSLCRKYSIDKIQCSEKLLSKN